MLFFRLLELCLEGSQSRQGPVTAGQPQMFGEIVPNGVQISVFLKAKTVIPMLLLKKHIQQFFYLLMQIDDIDLLDLKAAKKKDKTKKASKTNAVEQDVLYEEYLNRLLQMFSLTKLVDKSQLSLGSINVIRMPKKSGIPNFVWMSKQMKRDPNHVMTFFLSQLNTEGSLAGEQLTVKYRLTVQQVETLFRKYVKTFVKCQLCKSMNTELTRDKQNRLQILQCQNCKSTKFVQILRAKKR